MTPDLLEKEIPTPVSTGEEDVRQFLGEIRSFPLLNAAQERQLARMVDMGMCQYHRVDISRSDRDLDILKNIRALLP